MRGTSDRQFVWSERREIRGGCWDHKDFSLFVEHRLLPLTGPDNYIPAPKKHPSLEMTGGGMEAMEQRRMQKDDLKLKTQKITFKHSFLSL
jgi:hypothetical protein